MTGEKTALDRVRLAMRELQSARQNIGETLATTKAETLEYRILSDQYERICKAITVLPHGGER